MSAPIVSRCRTSCSAIRAGRFAEGRRNYRRSPRRRSGGRPAPSGSARVARARNAKIAVFAAHRTNVQPLHSRWRSPIPNCGRPSARENRRQEEHIELIASENYASPAVHGGAGHRSSPTSTPRAIRASAITAAASSSTSPSSSRSTASKQLFHAEAANVQPHSGAQANQAVFFAALKPGDTILGMSLPHGGHLTHGSPVNMSGKWFNVVAYGLDPETELIDYDEAERLAREHKPKLIIAGASAYSRVIDWKRFRAIADERRRAADGRHGALRGADRGGRLSEPRSASPTSRPARRTRRCAGRAAASS